VSGENSRDARDAIDASARAQIHRLSNELPRLMREATAAALRDVMSDQELTKRFWETGYAQLQEHAVRNSSQWVGKKFVTVLVTAIVTAGFIWLVKTGALK
jgi:hypothetical protein